MTAERFAVEKFTELEYGIRKDGETLIGLSLDKVTAKYIVEQWNGLAKENEQLKQQIADWETAFDTCKHYKEAYGTEIVKIKQTIKDMIESERTEIGKMTLRQLWRQIQ